MGKGTIINHIADGKYNVTLNIDDSRAQDTITKLDASILQLNTVITELIASRGTAWAMYDSARTKLNIIIGQYVAGTATKKQVVAATVNMNAKYHLYTEYDRALRSAQLRQKALEKRKEYIENKLAENPESTIEAWCADLTENLSGEVGTIEIPNERINDVQIRPGYGGEAVYNASRDGQLQQVVSSTSAGVYYNYAIFPGWQKWKPTYRVGKITAKPTTDTAHVLLDDATSTAQNLDVNVSNTLSDVPIVYMDCDGEVFEIDDRVVVEFINQDYTNPRIIGFETNPKACAYNYFAVCQRVGLNTYNRVYMYEYATGNYISEFNTSRDPYGLCWDTVNKHVIMCTSGNRIYFYEIDGTYVQYLNLVMYNQYMRGVSISPDRDLLTVGYDTVRLEAYLQILDGFSNTEKSRSYLPSIGAGTSYIQGSTIYEGDLIICYLDGVLVPQPGGGVAFQTRIRRCNGLNINSVVTEWIEDINDYMSMGLGIDPDGNLLSLHWHTSIGLANVRKHDGISSTELARYNLIGLYPVRWEGLSYIL